MTNEEILQVNSLIKLGKLEEALQAVIPLEKSLPKVRILLQIATKYEYRQKQPEQALKVWTQALNDAELILEATQRAEAIALVAAATDSFESFTATEAVAAILQGLQNLPDDYSKFNALLRNHHYDQALQTAQTLSNSYLKVDALIKIAIERSQHGYPEQALELWQLASNVAQEIISIDEREKALVLVIQSVSYTVSYSKESKAGFLVISRSNRASEVYAQAIEIAKRIEKLEDKNAAIYNLACRIAEDQKLDQAIQLINENNVVVTSNSYAADPDNSKFYTWAEQSSLSEAYCFTDSPDSDDQTVIRIWSEENQPPCWYGFVSQRREKQWKLTQKDYLALHQCVG